MAIVRVQVSIPRDSALPEDAVTNTFHFSTTDTAFGTLGDVAEALEDFYGVVQLTLNAPVAFMASALNPGATVIKMWDMGDPKPRVPIYEETHDVGAAGATSLPGEVALVVSYHAEAESGIPAARKRGRFYFGPLAVSALEAGALDARPDDTFTSILIAAADALLTASDGAAAWTWIVYSEGARDNSDPDIPYLERPLLAPISSPVVAGHIDNAFDTQRRRGQAASSRSVFP